MNIAPKYEQFISHFVPGVIGTSGIIICIECYLIPGFVSNFSDKLSSWKNFALLTVLMISFVMFIGLWIDSIKHWTLEAFFRKKIGRPNNEDSLSQLDKLGVENYSLILAEYYFPYQYAVNSANAMLFVLVGLPICLFKKRILSQTESMVIAVALIIVILTLYKAGFLYYKRFYESFKNNLANNPTI